MQVDVEGQDASVRMNNLRCCEVVPPGAYSEAEGGVLDLLQSTGASAGSVQRYRGGMLELGAVGSSPAAA